MAADRQSDKSPAAGLTRATETHLIFAIDKSIVDWSTHEVDTPWLGEPILVADEYITAGEDQLAIVNLQLLMMAVEPDDEPSAVD